MKKILLCVFFLVLTTCISAQIVPPGRLVNWAIVPQHIAPKQPVNSVNVADFGAVGDGVTNDQPAIMDAISFLSGRLGYVYFPPGNYLVESPIILPDSCILQGAGVEQSMLTFNLSENDLNCISISKSQTANFVNIISGLDKGSNLITVDDTVGFSVGDYIEIRQQNGAWDVVPISWADYSVGQITKIIDITGYDLTLESELRIDYSSELIPQVRTIIPISNVGIQCIKIKRVDEPLEGSGANIYLNMAANCYVRGVESDSSVGSHISVNNCANILIDGNYFHHAFTYDGGGTRGYGVTLSHHTSECLVTNNIFKHLRHAMMVKTGSNGNIFSYNYSIDPYRSEQVSDASGDVSLHGHYAFSNLFEGNIVQNIVVDHYWGPSGPNNTFLRNRAELYGLIMTTSDLQQTNNQNFVGTEITNTEFLHGLYILTGEDNFQYANNVKGEIIPEGTNVLNDTSYYLTAAPTFWIDTLQWPSIGFSVLLGEGTIPAKVRYLSGGNLAVCPDSTAVSVNENISNLIFKIFTWPNPANELLNIELPNDHSGVISLLLFNTKGKLVYSERGYKSDIKDLTIRAKSFSSGIYLLRVETNNKVALSKVVIVH